MELAAILLCGLIYYIHVGVTVYVLRNLLEEATVLADGFRDD